MFLFNSRLSGLSYTFLGHSLSSLLLPTLLLWFSVSNIPVLQIPVAFLSPFLFAGLLYFFFNYLSVNESSLFETSTLRNFMKKISSPWSSLATITLRVQFECKCQDCLFVFLILCSLNLLIPNQMILQSFSSYPDSSIGLFRYMCLICCIFHLVPIPWLSSFHTKPLHRSCTP